MRHWRPRRPAIPLRRFLLAEARFGGSFLSYRGLVGNEPIGYFFAGVAALVVAGLLITTGFTPASWNISTSRFAMYLSSPSFSSQVENPKLFGGATPRPPRPPPAAPAGLGAPPPPAESLGPLQLGSERPDMPPAPIPRPGG